MCSISLRASLVVIGLLEMKFTDRFRMCCSISMLLVFMGKSLGTRLNYIYCQSISEVNIHWKV